MASYEITMTENVVTTITVTAEWLHEHGLPASIDALPSFARTNENAVFSAVDGAPLTDVEVTVTRRGFKFEQLA